MRLPLKVLNRLRLGRDVAARVAPADEKNHAWVYVYLLLNDIAGVQIIEGGEPKAVGAIPENDQIQFLVCRVEFSQEIIEEYKAGRLYEIENRQAETDERWQVRGVAELEDILSRWIDDGDQLHEPSVVGYEFDYGRGLIRGDGYGDDSFVMR